MENFPCPLCASTDGFRLECGHIRCHSCSLNANQMTNQCQFCDVFRVSNEALGPNDPRRLCADCNKCFDSDAEYEVHKLKIRCNLFTYGCTRQIDDCSMDKHLRNEAHCRAVRFCLNSYLSSSSSSSSASLHSMKSLTEICSKINTTENDDSMCFDDLLVTDFGDTSTTHQIECIDHDLLNNQQITHSLNDQLVYNEQTTNLIISRINELALEQQQQQNNVSISGNQTAISTISNQTQICHLCQNEYDTSIEHICQTSVNELKEKINRLSSEMKQLEEFTRILIDQNQHLARENNILNTQLSNVLATTNGILIWNINIIEAIRQPHLCQHSPLFSPTFSSLTGQHLLRVGIYLYGDSFAFPNHISIHLILTSAGNKHLSLPITVCLVDQTNNQQHVIQSQNNVDLNQSTIGIILRFSQFVPMNDVHIQGSRYVKDGAVDLIVKLHENESNQYDDYPQSIQNALQQIDSLTVS